MPHWRHSNFSRELQTLMISGQMVSFIFLFPTFDNRQIDYFHRKFKANCLCWVHIGLKIKSKCKIFLVFSYKLLIKAKLTLSKMEIIKIIGTLCYAEQMQVRFNHCLWQSLFWTTQQCLPDLPNQPQILFVDFVTY